MNKSLAIISLLLLSSACFSYAQADWRAVSPASVANYPDTASIYEEVAYISGKGMEGRARGSKGHSNAAFYIGTRLKNLGCKPVNGHHSFSFMMSDSTDVGHNILGIMHCSPKNVPQRYVIVGAHYDGTGIIDGELYPGADANASGVAMMLQIAQTFRKQLESGYSYNSNIIFVAFDSYTDGREGSRRLWQTISRRGIMDSERGVRIRPENISLMIDCDQVGSSMAPVHKDRSDYLIAIGEFSLRSSAQGILGRCNKFYGTDLDICKTYYGSENFTNAFYRLGDRKHFIRAGIPTMYFTSGITPTTNKTTDTAESLDYKVFRDRIILVFRFLEKLL